MSHLLLVEMAYLATASIAKLSTKRKKFGLILVVICLFFDLA